MNTLSKRLVVIEKSVRARGGERCATCKSWGRPVLLFEDGDGHSPEDIPDHSACPDCGWKPDRPTIVTIKYVPMTELQLWDH